MVSSHLDNENVVDKLLLQPWQILCCPGHEDYPGPSPSDLRLRGRMPWIYTGAFSFRTQIVAKRYRKDQDPLQGCNYV